MYSYFCLAHILLSKISATKDLIFWSLRKEKIGGGGGGVIGGEKEKRTCQSNLSCLTVIYENKILSFFVTYLTILVQ